MSNNALGTARADVWLLKEIEWRAIPNAPNEKIKVIMQTLNGPCSFIALCNILILRGDIVILPPERREVAYEFLSALVAEYLLRASPGVDIAAALTILPLTQNGLDLNPLFTGLSLFRPHGDGGALKLFEHANIKLVHGWLVDPTSHEYSVLSTTQDYDNSTDLIVAADSITKGQLVETWTVSDDVGESSNGHVQSGNRHDEMQKLSAEEREKVRNAVVVQHFLETTQSQLTYHGLFQLSSELRPGELVALFRNSHLSVLHKPAFGDGGLYTLVTDHVFAHESSIVWEKLDDIEGGSQFVDADLKPSVPVGGDYAGATAETVVRAIENEQNAHQNNADEAFARQLQAEEDARAQQLYQQQQQQNRDRRAQVETSVEHTRQQPQQIEYDPRQERRYSDEHQRNSGFTQRANAYHTPEKRKKKGDCNIM
ncbi:hypothetical protein SISNIDRAFT_486451 [Sistotremastrum niveocremeum HHB9708]|uniref:MINDY deubiquitinase domain-containing protein n=1 Tax=Sistotremastrum niveocremeum HHB9708 TaxID=1314777 RepID=A0A164TJD4_9AGAM|nr:hypothetical protein SISNIDRAFT_486451 [Sistotremastrum niveocremeum HHB9708]